MAASTILSASQLRARVGEEIATSDWFEVTQEHINEFAEATGDRQWIHVDPERAAKESPYGKTVAHGFLTLSMLSHLLGETITVTGMRMGINYGFNKVRFTGPVPSGSRIRARFLLAALDDIPNGIQMTWNVAVEREGEAKPVLVAEWLTRRYD
ncbi:MAG: MaoC family dehydratase [Burkholderiales bacterium]|nr:MaoC family dehydratase [Burkholderiales bacterium]